MPQSGTRPEMKNEEGREEENLSKRRTWELLMEVGSVGGKLQKATDAGSSGSGEP